MRFIETCLSPTEVDYIGRRLRRLERYHSQQLSSERRKEAFASNFPREARKHKMDIDKLKQVINLRTKAINLLYQISKVDFYTATGTLIGYFIVDCESYQSFCDDIEAEKSR